MSIRAPRPGYTVIDLAPYLRPGCGVWWGQASAEPTPLVHALLDQVDQLGPVRGFCGMSEDSRLTDDPLPCWWARQGPRTHRVGHDSIPLSDI